jgi:hypothetical protein
MSSAGGHGAAASRDGNIDLLLMRIESLPTRLALEPLQRVFLAQFVSYFHEGHCKPFKRAAADAVAFRMPLVLWMGGGNPTM